MLPRTIIIAVLAVATVPYAVAPAAFRRPAAPAAGGAEGAAKGKADDARRDAKSQLGVDRFRAAHALVVAGDYERALVLLEENIAKSPDAGDIDYSYGWACVCYAHLDRMDDALRCYEVLRTKHFGWLSEGANGANRNWDEQLEGVRKRVAASKSPQAPRTLARMRELDRAARQAHLEATVRLVERASAGDPVAQQQLKQTRYGVTIVELIASGRLRLAEPDGVNQVDKVDKVDRAGGTAGQPPGDRAE